MLRLIGITIHNDKVRARLLDQFEAGSRRCDPIDARDLRFGSQAIDPFLIQSLWNGDDDDMDASVGSHR